MSSGEVSPERNGETGRRFGELRGVQWRIDLGILPCESSSVEEFRRVNANSRRSYAALRRRLLINPHISKEESSSHDRVMDNPLSQNPDSTWGQYFQKAELEKMVDQDLSRLYPEHGSYFQTPGCQGVLRRILLLWCIRHPNYGYRQGMHELLAPLLYVLQADLERLSEVRKQYQDYFTDNFDGLSFSEDDFDLQNDQVKVNNVNLNELDPKIQTIISFSDAYGAEGELGIVLSDKFMEHDAYSMFDALMDGDGGVVAMANFFSHSPSPKNGLPPVIEASSALYHLLSIVDLSLYSHLVELGVEPQYFALRWLRVLFGREFALEDLLVIWDEIFLLDNSRLSGGSENEGVLSSSRGAFISSLAVSMILYLRSSLLATENATSCLQRLLNFPEDVDLGKLIKKAKTLMDLAVDAINSIPEPTKPRGHRHSLSTDTAASGSPGSKVPESYWEEKWRVMNNEKEEQKQASLNKVQNRIKGWSERVKMRLSRTDSAGFLSKVKRPPVRRNLVDDLACEGVNTESLFSSGNGGNEENIDHGNETDVSSVASYSSVNGNEDIKPSIADEVASPLPVSDRPEDINGTEKLVTNLKEKRPSSGKFQWLWMFARNGPEGSAEKDGEVSSDKDGYESEPTSSSVKEFDQNIGVPSSSTTTDETDKPEGVDPNKMYSLKDLSQSMLENIKVIESIFQQEKAQTDSVENLSTNAMEALNELRKISHILSERDVR